MTKEKFLVINGSPNAGGNTDFLIDRFVTFLDNVIRFDLREMNISPCRGCEKCSLTGNCIIRDDMYQIYEEIEACKCFLFFSPVFFGGVTSTLKSAIDRCQPFWARKNILGKKIDNNGRKALIVLIGGTSFAKGYECAALSVRWLLNVIEVPEVKSLFYMNIENNKDFSKYNLENDIDSVMDFFSEESEK